MQTILAMAGLIAAGDSAAITADGSAARAAWARVLERHVGEDGSVDFTAIRREPGDLREYVHWLETNGPRSTPEHYPEKQDRLAYYIDAYNSLAMWNVVTGRYEPRQKVRFFYATRFRIDGETRSLYSLENHVIRPLDEPRIHFALNCMVRSCPRLPREPWSAERLEDQLAVATRVFFSEARNLHVDHARREIRVSELIDFYPEDFRQVAPSLLEYVRAHAPAPIPDGYRLRFIPYDWTLNEPRSAAPSGGSE